MRPLPHEPKVVDPYARWFQKMNRGAADAPEHIRKAAHEWEKMKRARTTTHSPSSSSSSS
ncbi:hypothetical protein RHMOL_Rhmol05G0315400 [Rhododendron molle]|uniref:Uncharacterized protein n=1 Tax=Rhododendron molle TaxID=49168 RepID=A0ACC0NVC9_RHOML|nr:hypothetical protein RHMOL_Rhmol05G0315400 [Rhododendron molle]